MNGKKAKALRNMARELTIGMPEREYEKVSFGHPRVLVRDCTRSFYQRLKKAYQLQLKH